MEALVLCPVPLGQLGPGPTGQEQVHVAVPQDLQSSSLSRGRKSCRAAELGLPSWELGSFSETEQSRVRSGARGPGMFAGRPFPCWTHSLGGVSISSCCYNNGCKKKKKKLLQT